MPNFDVDKVFTYHAPHGDQAERYENIRAAARYFVSVAQGYTPASREQSLGFTAVQEAVMWFNASIAINEAE